MKVNLRGVFLTSEKFEETSRFYREVVGIPLEMVGNKGEYVYQRHDHNDMQIAIHDSAAFADYTHMPLAESNLTHVYFKIDDQKTFLAKLENMGISPFNVDDVVVTVIDPDGRKVMVGTAQLGLCNVRVKYLIETLNWSS